MSKKLILEFLASSVWALEGDYLERMTKIAMREDLESIQALEAKSGNQISNSTEIRGDVAVIHINGVISRYANLFHAVCGGVSTELLSKEFNQALESKSVKSIVLNIDSPGGEASGIHELGEMIFHARGRKPIRAYVGGMGCSAAYWIASACDRVVMDATAAVGSIGVVASVVKRDDQEGQTSYEFVSSQSPNKRLDVDSDKGQQAMQGQLDQMADVFIDRVARNMGVDRNQVLNDFGRGAMVIGQEAVECGMAKELGSLEGVISSLGSSGGHSWPSSGAKAVSHSVASAGLASFSAMVEAGNATPEILAGVIREQLPEVAALFEVNQGAAEIVTIGASAALDMADSVNLPLLARTLSGMGLEEAERYISNAQGLKDVLAAAGLSGSFDILVENMGNPVRMIGMAIHETKAERDEADDGSRCITGEDYKPRSNTGFDPSSVYASRSNANR